VIRRQEPRGIVALDAMSLTEDATPEFPLARAARAVRRRLLPAVAILLAWSVGGCAWLDAKQRELALRPTPTEPTDVAKLQPGDRRFKVPIAAPEGGETQELSLWWLPQRDPEAPALLYLHGTFRNLYRNLPKIDAIRAAGFAILAVDYRGWGDSTSIVPSEATITADAWRAWAELVRLQPVARKRVIFGHSMGGAVAVALASQLHGGKDYGALVLESTFTNLPDVASAAGFWGGIAAAITTLEFDSRSRIGRVDGPVTMIHGTADHTVPIEVGRRLRDAARPGVHWFEIPGGSHSRLHSEAAERYREIMKDVIREIETPAPGPAKAR